MSEQNEDTNEGFSFRGGLLNCACLVVVLIISAHVCSSASLSSSDTLLMTDEDAKRGSKVRLREAHTIDVELPTLR